MQGTILADRYLLTTELGSGGMGAVYAASDLRTGGKVAVKLIHPVLSGNPEYTARLRREAQIAASLTSPRVVRVIDFGVDAGTGVTFLVQEFVDGETLADHLDGRGRLAVDDALAIAREVARALDAAYHAGIVHRDLKPANIMLTDGQVKVLDFGIARATGDMTITAGDSYMGTPAYCAPEREEGRGDIRTDIYALGVILYEMLAGRRPFEAPTALRMLHLHATAPPPPLPADIPANIRAAVERCLAKDPGDRFRTPAELLAALDGAPARPIAVGEPPPTLRLPGRTEPETPAAPVQAAASAAASPAGRSRRTVPLLVGGAVAALALAGVGAWVIAGRGGGSGPASIASPSPALQGAATAAATASLSGGAPASITTSPGPRPSATRTPRPNPSPQQLYQRLLDTPYAPGDMPFGFAPGGKERADLSDAEKKYNAVGAVSSEVTSLPPINDNAAHFTVYPSGQDARARFDAGFSNSDTITYTGSFNPIGVPAPAKGLTATYTNNGQKQGVSYCITVIDNVQVIGLSLISSNIGQGSNETACIVASGAVNHLQRVRSE